MSKWVHPDDAPFDVRLVVSAPWPSGTPECREGVLRRDGGWRWADGSPITNPVVACRKMPTPPLATPRPRSERLTEVQSRALEELAKGPTFWSASWRTGDRLVAMGLATTSGRFGDRSVTARITAKGCALLSEGATREKASGSPDGATPRSGD